MLYIGIDLGTSAVKLLLMDGNGEIKKHLDFVNETLYNNFCDADIVHW